MNTNTAFSSSKQPEARYDRNRENQRLCVTTFRRHFGICLELVQSKKRPYMTVQMLNRHRALSQTKLIILPRENYDCFGSNRDSITKYYFSYFSTKTYVVGTQKNRVNEPKHMFKLMGKKIFTFLRAKILFN